MSVVLEPEVGAPDLEQIPVLPEKELPPAVEVLRKVKKLLSNKERWCQGAAAKDALGGAIDWVGDPAATRFCAVGALQFVLGVPPIWTDDGPWVDLYRASAQLWAEEFGGVTDSTLVDVNDGRGYDVLMAGLDKALARFT